MLDILNGRKRRPTRPGEFLRDELLPQFELSLGEPAHAAGIPRRILSAVLMEKRRLSVDMAYRLGRVFDISPGLLIRMQAAVEAWDTVRANGREYARIRPVRKRRP